MSKTPEAEIGTNTPFDRRAGSPMLSNPSFGQPDLPDRPRLGGIPIPFPEGVREHISPAVFTIMPDARPRKKQVGQFLPGIKRQENTSALELEAILGIQFDEIPVAVPDTVRNRLFLLFNTGLGTIQTEDGDAEDTSRRILDGLRSEIAAGFYLPGANMFVDKMGESIVQTHEAMHSWIDQNAPKRVIDNRKRLRELTKKKGLDVNNHSHKDIAQNAFLLDVVSEGICEYGAIETELASTDEARTKIARSRHNRRLTPSQDTTSLLIPSPLFMGRQLQLTQILAEKLSGTRRGEISNIEFSAKYSVGYYFVATVMRYFGQNGVSIEAGLHMILRRLPRRLEDLKNPLEFASTLIGGDFISGWDVNEPSPEIEFWRNPTAIG